MNSVRTLCKTNPRCSARKSNSILRAVQHVYFAIEDNDGRVEYVFLLPGYILFPDRIEKACGIRGKDGIGTVHFYEWQQRPLISRDRIFYMLLEMIAACAQCGKHQ